jgi:hypothetical protein
LDDLDANLIGAFLRTTYGVYLHVKEKALARTAPPKTRPGRFRPSDALLAFLEGL